MLKEALNYARKGWAVFPLHSVNNSNCSCGKTDCGSAGKHPRVKTGFKEATTDKTQIHKWWTMWPDANIGIATGAVSGIVVLDVDPRHNGDQSYEELQYEFDQFPNTVQALTGGGGLHLFFAYPNESIGSSANLVRPGLDIRGDGGYIVAAPSVHKSGKSYEWELSCEPDDVDLAPMPEWLIKLIKQPVKKHPIMKKQTGRINRIITKKTINAEPTNKIIHEGGRNAALTSLAGSMHNRGMSYEAMLSALLIENQERCFPPLSETEVESIVLSVTRYDISNPVTQEIMYPDGVQKNVLAADLFFENGKFVPAALGDYILSQNHFYYDGLYLYVFLNGVYKREGETLLRQMITKVLGRKFKSSYINEVVTYIQINSWRDIGLMNNDDEWINLQNGLLNWRTGEFTEHDPNKYTTIQLPISYNPDADCPNIKKFLADVLPTDAIPTVEELFGYCMIPSARFEKAFMLTGSGANGKSTFINLLTRFIGEKNTSNVSLQDLAGNRFKLAQIKDKLLNTFSDLSPKAMDDSSIFKTIVSGDRTSAEFKGKDSFDFRPFARLIFSANDIPGSRDVGEAFFRRWIILPFPNTFTHGGSADERLIDKITTDKELSGLLNLALNGLRRLNKNSQFTMNDSTRESLEQYRRDTDSVATFLSEMCVIDQDAKCGTTDLYNSYKYWCDESGLHPLGKIKFNKRLEQRVPNIKKGRIPGKNEYWNGIGLSSDITGYGF